jgi:hypothetical protein
VTYLGSLQMGEISYFYGCEMLLDESQIIYLLATDFEGKFCNILEFLLIFLIYFTLYVCIYFRTQNQWVNI